MKHLFIGLIVSLLFSCQDKQTQRFELKLNADRIPLGDSTVYLLSSKIDHGNILLMNVHENEQTAIRAMIQTGLKDSLPFIFLHQSKQRRIAYRLNDTIYSVDPNRIYTDTGRVMTLKDSFNYTLNGEQKTKFLADRVLKKLEGVKWLITFHNNTDENYSIRSYMDSGDESDNTGELYINKHMDEDDFVYTTNAELFHFLKKKKVNVILQSEMHFIDDGSLSIYCAQKGINYANIETEHDHLDKQMELMTLLAEFIEL